MKERHLVSLYLYGGKWGKWAVLVGAMTDEQIDAYVAAADRYEICRNDVQRDISVGKAAE